VHAMEALPTPNTLAMKPTIFMVSLDADLPAVASTLVQKRMGSKICATSLDTASSNVMNVPTVECDEAKWSRTVG